MILSLRYAVCIENRDENRRFVDYSFTNSAVLWRLCELKAEVDFVIQMGNKIIPLEVKAERNLKAKSLNVYTYFYKPPITIVSSLEDLGQRNSPSGIMHTISAVYDWQAAIVL